VTKSTSPFRLNAINFLAAALVGALVAAGGAFQALAQDIEPTTFWKAIEEKGVYERLWEAARLYEDQENSVIQTFSILGRYNGQYWNVNADQGSADGWENRRIYLGTEAMLFHDFTIHAQVKFSDDLDPFYDGIYQAFVNWSPSESLTLVAGRMDFLFAGLERSMSSTKIGTFERGLLANQVMPHEVVGTGGKVNWGDFTFRAGVMSGSIEREFTSFAGGFGAVVDVGYELPLFYSEGSLHLDYLYNNGNSANNALEPYDHILSLWHRGRSGPFDLGVELIAGHGIEGRNSVLGVTGLATWLLGKNLIRKGDALEAAFRYQYAVSDGDNGLELEQRYEQEVVPGGLGNAYHAVYVGLNYLIYGNRFKLMNGVEYSVMKDSALGHDSFNGWTYLAGVRVYF
jgi:phosphate-selective porin OprO/OprP